MTAKQLAILILLLTLVRAAFYFFSDAENMSENEKKRILKYFDYFVIADVALVVLVFIAYRATGAELLGSLLKYSPPVFNIIAVIAIRIMASILLRVNPFDEKFKRVFVEYVDSIVVAGIAALFIIQFLFRTFYIPSGSMLPTLQLQDYIIVNEFIYKLVEPERGDIVVFNPPPEANAGDKEFIKRIIGLPGETISVRNGMVYIDEKPLDEPYIKYPPDYYYSPRKIPDGHLFVMGDNRSSSADSHVWGFLPKENIVGKAFVIVLPPQRIRLLD